MKRLIALIMILCFAAASAAALTLSDTPLSGEAFYPEGTDMDTAVYHYTYQYPQAEGDDETAEMINSFYTYLAEDALTFAVPIMAESIEPSEELSSTEVTTTVRCLNDAYFSDLVKTVNHISGYDSIVYSAHTFALTGSRAGEVVSLPWIMGLLTENENDTWLEDRQTAKADTLVREMVWNLIEDNSDDLPYYDDLDYDWLCDVFYPEEDFYMNADGDLVFFLQIGSVADASAGLITFTFSVEELLDEL